MHTNSNKKLSESKVNSIWLQTQTESEKEVRDRERVREIEREK